MYTKRSAKQAALAVLQAILFSHGSFYEKNINLMRQPVCATNVNVSLCYTMTSECFSDRIGLKIKC